MSTYKKFITEEGKNEVLKIAFSDSGNDNTFRYLALGTNSGTAAETGLKENFVELDRSENYRRVGVSTDTEENTIVFDNNGTATISFIVSEDNYTGSGAVIKEIALCNDAEADITSEQCKVFAFCEVPEIEKTSNISLKYTLRISIE